MLRRFIAALVVIILTCSQVLAIEQIIEDKSLGVSIIDLDSPTYPISKNQIPQSGKMCKLKNYNSYPIIIDCYNVDKISGQKSMIWSKKVLSNDETSGVFILPSNLFEVREPFKGYHIGYF